MRGPIVAAFFLSLVGPLPAYAADISGTHVGPNHGSYSGYEPLGARIEPIIVYDYEPGVIVRSYWDTPWANRHYFPTTGRRPKVGRLERNLVRRPTKAEDYYRFWSVSSVFGPEWPGAGPRPFAIDPGAAPYDR